MTRKRLRAVDPKASIVLAGLPNSRLGVPALDYLRAVYARPGARSLFDVVALHPYAQLASGVVAAVTRGGAYMNTQRDRRTPIWITEIGWGHGRAAHDAHDHEGRPGGEDRPDPPLAARRPLAPAPRTVCPLFASGPRLRGGGAAVVGAARRVVRFVGQAKPAWRALVRFTGGQPGDRLRSVAG